MKWRGRRQSGNIIDRRGSGGGGRGGMAIGGGGIGVLAIVAIGWLLGVDLTPLLNGQGGQVSQSGVQRELTEAEREMGEFVSVVLADTEEVWTKVFAEQTNGQYRPTQVVLYSGGDSSACGYANSAVGPFYCPADQRIYLDTSFFAQMEQQLGAGGDFAFAYVVAHEVGHHVENLLGILQWSQAARQGVSEARSNEVSVRVELMADCLSGIFAKHMQSKGYLDRGDIGEAMNAAEKIGDDTLQRNAGRRPMPDSFTHGSSAQRQRWFDRGYQSGMIADCDTRDLPSRQL